MFWMFMNAPPFQAPRFAPLIQVALDVLIGRIYWTPWFRILNGAYFRESLNFFSTFRAKDIIVRQIVSALGAFAHVITPFVFVPVIESPAGDREGMAPPDIVCGERKGKNKSSRSYLFRGCRNCPDGNTKRGERNGAFPLPSVVHLKTSYIPEDDRFAAMYFFSVVPKTYKVTSDAKHQFPPTGFGCHWFVRFRLLSDEFSSIQQHRTIESRQQRIHLIISAPA